MFKHIFVNRLKCLIRDKESVFWTLFFPILLATFFNLAFSNLTKQEDFNTINIAVINNEAYQNNESFKCSP
jgi:ABC-2 type transport system permease protein